ncbi:MAG: hypothetical protein LQ352_002831 [Teloschistes flavicans]|nr:MAG: hypothetical protein LQ352_002831 [Teloschistes flavicans]
MWTLLLFVSSAAAATVTYDFNITWVTAQPDGFSRPTIGINGQWPIPHITATVGDRVIVNVNNQLGNQTTSLHFHGLYMNGTAHMDGPVGVSQCSIPVDGSFVYDFSIKQPGTYWYHSHDSGQYPDGLRGALIVNDPDSPYKDQYDEELILTLSDWYHDQMPGLLRHFISYANPTGAEPVPDAALMNDTQNLNINVEPGKTYMFRIVNMAAFAAQYLWFEGHTMRIVEVDGIYTEAAEAEMIYITAAQRYSVLITTKNDTSANFAIVGSMDQDLFDAVPETLNPNVTGWLVYDKAAPLPTPTLIDAFDPFDDFTLVPYDRLPLLQDVTRTVRLDMKMDNLGDGANYAFFNDRTYTRPKVPTLYSALTTGEMATDVGVYGSNTNSFVLGKGEVVEIVLNSLDPGKHPFHLHGHWFQAVVRSEEEAGVYVNNETFPEFPMRRDTFMVKPNGNIVLRFRADNPAPHYPNPGKTIALTPKKGIWLFHCHIEWHVSSGLMATLIEAPLDLQRQLSLTTPSTPSIDNNNNDSALTSIPSSHLEACAKQGVPVTGNAAGNTVDLLDLTGENLPPGPLAAGFQARGIVALVFSVVTAFAGMAVIGWYGWLDVKGSVGAQTAAAVRS